MSSHRLSNLSQAKSWTIEIYHRKLKQNTGISRAVRPTQAGHNVITFFLLFLPGFQCLLNRKYFLFLLIKLRGMSIRHAFLNNLLLFSICHNAKLVICQKRFLWKTVYLAKLLLYNQTT